MENKDSTVVLKWRCENRSSNSITGVILIDNKKKKKKRKMRKRGAEKEGKKGKIKNELTTHGKAIISTPRWARFFFSSLFFFFPLYYTSSNRYTAKPRRTHGFYIYAGRFSPEQRATNRSKTTISRFYRALTKSSERPCRFFTTTVVSACLDPRHRHLPRKNNRRVSAAHR